MNDEDDIDIRPPDHEQRLAVARRIAAWELGSSAWADRLVGAYLWPVANQESLDRVKERYEKA
jgi:hypothetical protein